MNYCHPHNLISKTKNPEKKSFGIEIRLDETDTFSNLLDKDWKTTKWFPSEKERDIAYSNMAKRHGYYRNSDNPKHILRKIYK